VKTIDEARLQTDLAYRYEYLAEFIGFSAEDVARIHSLAVRLTPQIPALVDATYAKLLSYNATARHFLPRQFGFEGPLPDGLAALGDDAAQIQFRKEHLRRYLQSLLGNSYDARMVKYLDVVGKIHTPQADERTVGLARRPAERSDRRTRLGPRRGTSHAALVCEIALDSERPHQSALRATKQSAAAADTNAAKAATTGLAVIQIQRYSAAASGSTLAKR